MIDAVLTVQEIEAIYAYWRASLNLLITSTVWRRDHNGFTHQDPGFLDCRGQ